MADLTITPANVAAGGGFGVTTISQEQAAVAIAQGQAVIQVSGETKWRLADANQGTADYAGATKIGVALTPAAIDGYFIVATEGPYIVGATVVKGTVYIASTTPGGIAPIADFAGYTSSYCTVIGQAISTTQIDIIRGAYTGVNNI